MAVTASCSALSEGDCTICLPRCSLAECVAPFSICCDAEECPSASFVGWDWECCTGPGGEGQIEDCPDCWSNGTPTESSQPGEDLAGGGQPEILMGDAEVEEILARCCCGIDFLPTVPLSAPTFSCRWEGCSLAFETKALLALHVNTTHLTDNPHPSAAVNAIAPPVDTEALLRHLLDASVAPVQPPPDPCASEPHQHHVHEVHSKIQLHSHSHHHNELHAAQSHSAPSHSHLARHPHSHSHSHFHSHKQQTPYGVVAPLPTPSPSPEGAHACAWHGCTLCFETSAELMLHLGSAHVGSGKAQYHCEWDGCEGKTFSQRQKVMRHLQTHTGDRPFACEVCGRSFSEATTLTQHMRVHTNEKPYKCSHPGCGKTFALAAALTIHLRTHTGAKPFLCPHEGCSAAFAESSNLSKHVRTHKGVRPHTCPECGKAFARSDQLGRHRRIHSKKREGQKSCK